jgi:membrane-associated protease RseP (regulator of RpoE activity)
MQPIKSRLIFMILAFLSLANLIGCSVLSTASTRPAWIDSPGDGVSSSAAFHVKGNQAQEDLAIARAREEFAKRHGVKVSSASETSQIVSNDRMSSVSSKEMTEKMQGNEVKAVVKEKWKDPNSGVLWVWLVPSHP